MADLAHETFDPGPLAAPGPAGILAIRHGRSTANDAFAADADTPVPGRDADVPLSDLGVRQAETLGGLLAAQPPDLVICSPYRRTRQTWAAMVRAARALVPGWSPPRAVLDERLRDREMGVLELHPPAAIRRLAPQEAHRRIRQGGWAYRAPGGESLADVALRLRALVADLDRAAAGARVLIVTHDAVIAVLRDIFDGAGGTDSLDPVPNASVSEWRCDGGRFVLARWADTRHLG
ncbi:histidine phosphatase family protein [Nocardia farcinica]|uniref:histidine phosphatase family protein n=1 Tax=Nocardia farcinica TaxID=37329 RepID=UPI000DFB4031|nr:histidine phosphatase family protein [Nocardia farcinica]MBF6419653.1 histidine phosphatase family protein [Nocardia farcinica]MBF6431130.1 histidine phosphatase family protein [Nocardia farcinica]MBF6501644.1 histidine phosphatase family protein [Nocardia farcinica]SUE28583.1 phosphoglycerate mutase [Nocardia farcinica]